MVSLRDACVSSARPIIYEVQKRTGEFDSWQLGPLSERTVPCREGYFIVPALVVRGPGGSDPVLLGLSMPERIAEHAYLCSDGGVTRVPLAECNGDVIPAVGIEGYGNYELFYSRSDPSVGIAVLRRALDEAADTGPIAEDLAYILRDEGRAQEAIEAFTRAIAAGPSSNYLFLERGRLFEKLGDDLRASEDLKRAEGC